MNFFCENLVTKRLRTKFTVKRKESAFSHSNRPSSADIYLKSMALTLKNNKATVTLQDKLLYPLAAVVVENKMIQKEEKVVNDHMMSKRCV